MAKIGLKMPVFAPGTYEDENGTTVNATYGTGFQMGHAVSAEVTINHTDAVLDADDTIVERDNTVTSADVTLTLDDMTDEHIAAVCGYEYSEGKLTIGGESETAKQTTYGGFGYIRKRIMNGVTSYIVYWFYKVAFSESEDNAQTAKSSGTEFQTMPLKGTAMAAKDGILSRSTYATEAEAVSALKALAHIA